jgi:hypothetical protein
MRVRILMVSALVATLVPSQASGQGERPTLHVNPRRKECSFQLDSSLTRAQPMGRGHYEVSMLQWETGIDDSDDAWNDTFVHPDSTHWLFEGNGLKFPGLMLRAGVTDRMDVGLYVTKAFGANYGFFGGQLQRSFARGPASPWAAAARASFVRMYGPEDLAFAVYGVDLLASRAMPLSRRMTVSPYVGLAGYLATSHETTDAVDLDDERVLGAQGMLGAELRLSRARLAAEYGVAKVRSLSFKLGVGW